MKSWKTTTAGVVAGLGIIATQVSYLLDNDVLTTFSIEACFAALGIMGIGFFARDNKVTSETVGAKWPARFTLLFSLVARIKQRDCACWQALQCSLSGRSADENLKQAPMRLIV